MGWKRIFAAFGSWMILGAAAHGQMRPALVVYPTSGDAAVRAVRVGDEAYVPTDDVGALGWRVESDRGITAVVAEGNRVETPLRTFGGKPSVPVLRTLRAFGADGVWRDDRLVALSVLSAIRVRDGQVEIASALPFRVNASTLISPPRVVLDLPRTRLNPSVAQDVDGSARIQTIGDDVRITVDAIVLPKLPASGYPVATKFQLALDQRAAPVAPVVPDPPEPTDPPSTPELRTITLAQDISSATATLLRIPDAFPTADPVVTTPAPDVAEIFLPGVFARLDARPRFDDPDLVGADARTDAEGTYVRLILGRPLAVEVSRSADGVSIQVVKPVLGPGLAGKLVVVDPGHGGHDGGAKGGDHREKNLALATAKLIAAELRAAGARVVMTRTTDVFIPLNTRSAMANRLKADLFVSCHYNSTGGPPTQSGTITFYHGTNDVSRLLAECIQRELAQVVRLPNLGAWSDRRIYKSGFAVLRQTKMPGVLLELAFINHPRDRARITDGSFPQEAARAVVRGIKTFLGDGK